jgi:Phosphopantetheine attachment site
MKKDNTDSAPDETTEKNPVVEQRENLAPRTPVEELIAGLYASILNVSSLGVYDNLELLGFTPEMASRLNPSLQQIFHVDIPVEQLLQCATIDSLVNLLLELWGGREIVEEIAWTFLQIERLSDDEVRSQLTTEISTARAAMEKPDQERNG